MYISRVADAQLCQRLVAIARDCAGDSATLEKRPVALAYVLYYAAQLGVASTSMATDFS